MEIRFEENQPVSLRKVSGTFCCKTQVRQLSRHLTVPAVIVDKQPSADLWEGQTDEAELGFTYEAVDKVLCLLVDQRYEVERTGRRESLR